MLIEQIAAWGEATFAPAATPDDLAAVEASLGAPLPTDLRNLLIEANGIEGDYGLGLLWDAQRIASDNVWCRTDDDYRELYMPFDGMLFFADAGNGDQFAISLAGNREIYIWNHEDDSRSWVASTVLAYLQEWMTGRLSV